MSDKRQRIAHLNSTVCYLKRDNKVLMIKFSKKWGQVYAPPGGKFETGESPLDCILREYYEKTGLKLINPRLQGMSYWRDNAEGIIFIYVAENFEGDLKETSEEGCIEWIKIEDLPNLKQFSQNEKVSRYFNISEIKELNTLSELIFSSLIGLVTIWISGYFILIQLYKNTYPMEIIERNFLKKVKLILIYSIINILIGVLVLTLFGNYIAETYYIILFLVNVAIIFYYTYEIIKIT